MKTPFLIGVHGVAFSGKETTFNFVEKWAQKAGMTTRRRGFADKLKWSVARIFFPAISMEDAIEWANEIKQDRGIMDNYVEMRCSGSDVHGFHTARITGRQLLQHYGTEAAREIFGSN